MGNKRGAEEEEMGRMEEGMKGSSCGEGRRRAGKGLRGKNDKEMDSREMKYRLTIFTRTRGRAREKTLKRESVRRRRKRRRTRRRGKGK